jgi:hypothetical protein
VDCAYRENVKVDRKDRCLELHTAISTPVFGADGASRGCLCRRAIGGLTDQQCLNLCILSAVLLGILYLFFGAFPLVFQHNHGFTISQTGLAFLGETFGWDSVR